MIHEMRQNFIHTQARKLKEKTGLELNTPEMFELVKDIIDCYDSDNSKLQHHNV